MVNINICATSFQKWKMSETLRNNMIDFFQIQMIVSLLKLWIAV